MLINISSDIIYIYCKDQAIQVPRGELEIQLPQVIYNLYSEHKIDNQIFVINGPGSFTNLRIGCLVLNMLKDFIPGLQLFTVPKSVLYTRLYESAAIPALGLMYIGQQKNYRICDLAAGSYEKTLVDLEQLDTYFDGEYWVDTMTAFVSSASIAFQMSDTNQIIVSYNNTQTTHDPLELGFALVEAVAPNYILEPNISVPKNP